MGDVIGRLIFLMIIAVLAWLVIPRTLFASDTIMFYWGETGSCNAKGYCGIRTLYPTLKLRVDQAKSQVVWLNTESGELGSWTSCTIADTENWECTLPYVRMKNGKAVSNDLKVRYLYGWEYRLAWFSSLFSDEKK